MSIDNPSNPEEEMPDWLKKLQGSPGSQGDPDIPSPVEPEEQHPQGLKDESSTAQDEPQEAPDWLEVIRRSAGKGGKGQPEQASNEGDADEPEWLRTIRQKHAKESDSPQPEPGYDQITDFNTLLQSIRAKDEQQPAEIENWLSSLINKKTTERPASSDATEVQESGSEDLDWISGITEEQESKSDEDVPEWLSSIGVDESTEGKIQPDDWLGQHSGSQATLGIREKPEWLEDIESEDEESPRQSAFTDSGLLWSGGYQEDEQPPTQSADSPEGEAGWLASFGAVEEAFTSEDKPVDAAYAFDKVSDVDLGQEAPALPDWMSDDDQDQKSSSAGAISDQGTGLDIAPAELPSWLQAMRPADTAPPLAPLPADIGEKVTIGPLAGLNDALPAEPEVIQFGGRTPQQPSGITVNKAQQEHVDLLLRLVEQEQQPLPVLKRTVALPQQIIRWVITGVLFLVVFVPVFFGSTNVALPSPTEPVTAVRDIIEALPPGMPVLVAFEYQPGFSAEMQAAAVAVLDHMLIKGVQPVFISTQPAGPGLVEQFLQTNLNEHPYISQKLYSNLGFISGGSAAMVNFATDPRGTLPLPLADGLNGWDQAPLSGIQQITDFGLLLVITEDPDTARSWIEQVQPNLVDKNNPAYNTPLIMVISAQAEPLVYPYFLTSPRQLSGMITGLAGGASYESGLRTKVARQYWDGFTWGINITVLILLFGGLINLGRAWVGKR